MSCLISDLTLFSSFATSSEAIVNDGVINNKNKSNLNIFFPCISVFKKRLFKNAAKVIINIYFQSIFKKIFTTYFQPPEPPLFNNLISTIVSKKRLTAYGIKKAANSNLSTLPSS